MTGSSDDVSGLPESLRKLTDTPRVFVRRSGVPAPDAKCVVYWMQRAERGVDNPALDCAIEVANELGLPVVAFFSAISNFPRANLRHLMLRPDVVDAVKANKFHIYAVGTIDEGIEVLTGVPAGARDPAGSYVEGTVNERVQKKLQQFTEQQKHMAASGGEKSADTAQ